MERLVIVLLLLLTSCASPMFPRYTPEELDEQAEELDEDIEHCENAARALCAGACVRQDPAYEQHFIACVKTLWPGRAQ